MEYSLQILIKARQGMDEQTTADLMYYLGSQRAKAERRSEQAMPRLILELYKNIWFSNDRVDALDSVLRDWLVQFWHPFVLRSLLEEVWDDDDEAAMFSMICVIYLCLYLYLVTANWGGTKTYNPGTREFRVTYVSLLLFRGSYVWIKFRAVARRNSDHNSREGYVYVRTREDSSGTPYFKYEPRYTPPGKKNPLPLAEYRAKHDAEVVLQFAKFQFDEDARVVDLGEGFRYTKSEQERNFSTQDKWAWIPKQAKKVLKEYQAPRPRVAGGDRLELVDAAVSSEDVGATARPEQVGAENLTCDITAVHDMDILGIREDDMNVRGGTPRTEGRENEQPNITANEILNHDISVDDMDIFDIPDICENLTGGIMADEFLNAIPDNSVDVMNIPYSWVDNMTVPGGTAPTEGRENEQPNLQNEQLEGEQQQQPRQIQPSLEQPAIHWLQNWDLRDKNDRLKRMYTSVPGLPPFPLGSDGENFTQQPLELQNSELSLENQHLKSILESVLAQL